MNTLFIGKRYYTNRDALDERFGRIYRIPYHWAQAGRACRLWLIDYHGKFPRFEREGNLDICSTPVPGWKVARRLLGEMLGRTSGAGRPNLIVASGDCYIGLLGYIVAHVTRAAFVFDMYDKYDEFAAYRRFPGFDPQSYLLRRSDVVTFASRALMNRIGGDAMCDPLIVPNGIDASMFRPLDQRESRAILGLPPAATLVGYFGSMDPERGVSDLLGAVEKLRREGAPVELLLGGHEHEDVDLSPSWVRYLGNIEFARMPLALACCDVLAIPYRNSPFLDMASSCKIAEYIAAHRPIVATKTPNLLANFPVQAEELSGVLGNPGDVNSIARALRAQLDEPRFASMPAGMDWPSISRDLGRRLDELVGP